MRNLKNVVLLFLTISESSQVWAQQQAQAKGNITEGKVITITLTVSGSGYTTAPKVSLVGGGGIGATAVAILTNDNVEKIHLQQAGSNYLTAPQVILTPPIDFAQDLLGWWRGEGTAQDELNEHPGQISGKVDYAEGKVGQCFYLNSPGAYISCGRDEVFNFQQGTGDFTVETWVRLNGGLPHDNEYDIVGKVNDDLSGGWALLIDTTISSQLFFTNLKQWETVYNLPVGTYYKEWHHVAFTKQGQRLLLFDNGQSVATLTNQLFGLSNSELRIGAVWIHAIKAPFDTLYGFTDELAIYGRALAANEIKEIYDRGSQGKYVRPLVTELSTNTAGFLGGSITFSPKVMGTSLITYQWLKQGLPLANATNSSLTLTNLQVADEGEYSLMVYNQYGSDTMPVASLEVKAAQLALGLTPKLTIEGVPGKTYAIQATTNLDAPVLWTTLTNVTLAQPVEAWYDYGTDTTKPDQPKRYYQVIAAP